MITAWVLFLLEGICSMVFSEHVSENSFIFAFVIIIINAFACLYDMSKCKYSEYLAFGYLFRIALLVWDCNFSSIWQLPNSGLDTWTFHLSAISGIQTGNFGRGGVYAQTVSVIYRMFGIQMPIAQYSNIILSMSMIVIAIKILETLELEEVYQRISVLLLCFLPNLAIMNAILLRETVVMFFVTVSALFFIYWYKGGKSGNIVWCILFGLLGAMYHSGGIAIALGGAVVYFLYDPVRKRFQLSSGRIFLCVLLMAGFLVINNAYGDIFTSKFGRVSSAEDIIETAEIYNSGGSAYTVGFNISNTYLNLIVNTPFRMFYFIGSPMPWNWRGLNDIIAFTLDAVLFLYAVWVAVKEMKNTVRCDSKYLIIIFFMLAMISAAVFAWGVSNAGTALRHREKFITIYVILIAACMQNKKLRLSE